MLHSHLPHDSADDASAETKTRRRPAKAEIRSSRTAQRPHKHSPRPNLPPQPTQRPSQRCWQLNQSATTPRRAIDSSKAARGSIWTRHPRHSAHAATHARYSPYQRTNNTNDTSIVSKCIAYLHAAQPLTSRQRRRRISRDKDSPTTSKGRNSLLSHCPTTPQTLAATKASDATDAATLAAMLAIDAKRDNTSPSDRQLKS